MDDDYFTITYIVESITNSPAGRQLPYWSKKNVLVIEIPDKEAISE